MFKNQDNSSTGATFKVKYKNTFCPVKIRMSGNLIPTQ